MTPATGDLLRLNHEILVPHLERFLRANLSGRGFSRAVLGLSGGVDSSVVAHLAARALGPEAVTGVMMPGPTSSPESLAHAQLVAKALGMATMEVPVTEAVHGYEANVPGITPHRRGNLMARLRAMILFDLSEELGALPVGTSNKSERMLGYFTWHGDDALPINPIADLFKVQVWDLARHLGVPEEVVAKAPSADLIEGQTDEGDLGITYADADLILHHLLAGFSEAQMLARGLDPARIQLVRERVDRTHWKRHLPAMAMVSETAINEFYLRPLDY